MKTLFWTGMAAVALLTGGCVARNDDGGKARADYGRSLGDSIAALQSQIDSCNSQMDTLRDRIGGWLPDFTTVANPREAGSYIILTSCKDRYPLNGTGLVARINDSGQFELVAALSGGVFDQISVTGAAGSASSAVVPNDQALNYRTASMTTVSFTGAQADSIGSLIAGNEHEPLTVTYIQGKPVRSWRLDGDNAAMISYTYMLYSSQRDLNRLERRVPMLHEKINLLRAHRDRQTESDSTEADKLSDK